MRHSTYLNELLRLRCGPDLLASGVFPNAKEVTESFAAFHAVRKHVPWADPKARDIGLVVVGDGSTPRTGAVFAHRTKWHCVSIDPTIRAPDVFVARLSQVRARVESVEPFTFARAIVVAVHSHASLEASVRVVRAGRVALVSMPCCVPDDVSRAPSVEYRDPHVWSPDNLVRVWPDIGSVG